MVYVQPSPPLRAIQYAKDNWPEIEATVDAAQIAKPPNCPGGRFRFYPRNSEVSVEVDPGEWLVECPNGGFDWYDDSDFNEYFRPCTYMESPAEGVTVPDENCVILAPLRIPR